MPANYHREEIRRHGDKSTWRNDYDIFGTPFETGSQKGGLRLRKWLIGMLLFLFASLLVINRLTVSQIKVARIGHTPNQDNYIQPSRSRVAPTPASGFLVRTLGCRIPSLKLIDPAIERYIHTEAAIRCEYGDHLPLIESNDTAIFVNPQARSHYYTEDESVDCCWRSFTRRNNSDDTIAYDSNCHNFEDSISITKEFIKVECTKNKQIIYRDYHAFVPRKPRVEERCRNATQSIGDGALNRLSVLVIGLDSISRLNFHRMMPRTINILRDLEAVEMLGYNKVGDNTYPNLVPVLSGLSVDELQARCWQDRKKPFDDCPFLWKNFSSAGYKTILGEDACSMATFNYLKPGFHVQPTDYYLRPYCIGIENEIGNTHKLNANLCVGTRRTFDNLLHYTRKVATTFSDDAYFAFFWEASLTHDFLNYPQLGDLSYSNFLRHLKNSSLLKNTALIMMSDHGMRWGDFRQTYQGRMEESLPFVFLSLPKWWREKFPVPWANLRKNARSLTTPFDLHETLLDMSHPRNLREWFLQKRAQGLALANGKMPRGISWFLPIPDRRSCSLAEIPEHWCMCHRSNNVSLDDPILRETAEFMLDRLNRMLAKYPQCALLKLKSLLNAKMWTHETEQDVAKAQLVDYTIILRTSPGDAIFEGTVRYSTTDASREMVGSIGRLNVYGTQSACVDDFIMRLYCYCH